MVFWVIFFVLFGFLFWVVGGGRIVVYGLVRLFVGGFDEVGFLFCCVVFFGGFFICLICMVALCCFGLLVFCLVGFCCVWSSFFCFVLVGLLAG